MNDRIATGRVTIDVHPMGDSLRFVLEGQIDGGAKLVDSLREIDASRIIFDLEKLSLINSIGVREWVQMMQSFAERGIEVTISRCSEAMVRQLNLIVEAKGHATIESFFAPYMCQDCGLEATLCVDVAQHQQELEALQPPSLPCPECGADAEFDEMPGRYILFLQRRPS